MASLKYSWHSSSTKKWHGCIPTFCSSLFCSVSCSGLSPMWPRWFVTEPRPLWLEDRRSSLRRGPLLAEGCASVSVRVCLCEPESPRVLFALIKQQRYGTLDTLNQTPSHYWNIRLLQSREPPQPPRARTTAPACQRYARLGASRTVCARPCRCRNESRDACLPTALSAAWQPLHNTLSRVSCLSGCARIDPCPAGRMLEHVEGLTAGTHPGRHQVRDKEGNWQLRKLERVSHLRLKLDSGGYDVKNKSPENCWWQCCVWYQVAKNHVN